MPSIALHDIDVVGHYALRRRLGHREAVHFTAHADPKESDLSPADLDAVAQLLTRTGPGGLAVAAAKAMGSAFSPRMNPTAGALPVVPLALIISRASLSHGQLSSRA